MEAQIQDIELINKYLNNRLSTEAIKDFETRLKSDDTFRLLYEEHVVLLEGIRRQKLKTEIKTGKQRYIRGKWLRYLGGSLGTVVLFAIIYFNVYNSDKAYLKERVNFESEYLQKYYVSADSLVEIIGEKGTVVRFNPNDLETSSKKPFSSDSLQVELIELVNKQDLLLVNAQTVSNGNWLISGGAFKIDIKANNESLVLKEGLTINATFPKNTNKANMKLFYGNRDKEGYMNWESAGDTFRPNPFVISIEEGYVVDTIVTKRYGVDSFKEVHVSDTLGFMSIEDLKERFPKGNFYNKDIDTIRLLKESVRIIDYRYDCDLSWLDNRKTFKTKILDSLYDKKEVIIDSILIDLEQIVWSECREIFGRVTRQITKQKHDAIQDVMPREEYQALLLKYNEEAETFNYFNKASNSFYKSIDISNLGWINIDKFTQDEETVEVKLNFNIKTSHSEIYLIDEQNNSVLNIYSNEINLPVNRSFKIIALGIKGKDIYGFKKSFKFRKEGDLQIDFKKINESKIRAFLNLEGVEQPEKPIKAIIKTEILKQDSTSVKNEYIKPNEEIVDIEIPEKTSEHFSINLNKDTLVVCKEGTKLMIKANSFIDQNNQTIVGEINLKVTEYYKLSEVLLANLSTQSNDKLLETGGMLFMEAKQNGKSLGLKENKPIEIIFPTKRKDMQLFTGNWEGANINWKLQNEIVLLDEVEEIDVEEDIQVPFAVIEEVPVFPGCENLNRNETRKCTSDKINQFVQRKFNGDNIANDLGLGGRQRVNVLFNIDKNGDVAKIRSRSSEPELEVEAERVIAMLPKMKPGKQRGKAVHVPYSLPIVFQVDGVANVGRSFKDRERRDSIFKRKVENKLTKADKKDVTITEVNSYILRASKLGWINCDRFINTQNNIRYNVIMNDADGEIRLNMVFKSWRSVLSGRRSSKVFDFKMIPKNEKVLLIALKKYKGKMYLDVVETITKENPNIKFNFKEVDLKTLKSQLETIVE